MCPLHREDTFPFSYMVRSYGVADCRLAFLTYRKYPLCLLRRQLLHSHKSQYHRQLPSLLAGEEQGLGAKGCLLQEALPDCSFSPQPAVASPPVLLRTDFITFNSVTHFITFPLKGSPMSQAQGLSKRHISGGSDPMSLQGYLCQ